MGALSRHASDAQVALWAAVMDKLQAFIQLSKAIPEEVKKELYLQFVSHPEAGLDAIVKLAAEKGLQLDKPEIARFVNLVDQDNSFIDVSKEELISTEAKKKKSIKSSH